MRILSFQSIRSEQFFRLGELRLEGLFGFNLHIAGSIIFFLLLLSAQGGSSSAGGVFGFDFEVFVSGLVFQESESLFNVRFAFDS